MAVQTVTPSDQWKQVRRAYRVARFAPFITIRRGGQIAISADFVRMAAIERCTRVSLFLSGDDRRLGLVFHNDEMDDDAFILSRDGGHGRAGTKSSRLITASALVAQSAAVAALLREGNGARRYEPRKDVDGRWVIDLIPSFERVLEAIAEVDASATGIYRYRIGGETIYIGRGRLRDRLASEDRRSWQYDRIEYSILNDDVAERRWEAFWLNEYRQRSQRWPVHNRIGGVESSPACASTG